MKRFSMKAVFMVLLLALLTPLEAAAGDNGPAVRRARVLEASRRLAESMPEVQDALADDNPFVRRAAVRALVNVSELLNQALISAFESEDSLVRMFAFREMVKEKPSGLPGVLERAINDEDAEIRKEAVTAVAAMEPRTPELSALLKTAAEDKEPAVREIANRALSPFSPEPVDTVLFRDRPDMADYLSRIKTVFSKRLPSEEWMFKKDLGQVGHEEEWFKPGYSDKEWEKAAIEEVWEPGYVGVGWYRRSFELPERPAHMASEILFEGIDSSGWAWINGVYVGGQHIPGGAGKTWNRPFRLDVTDALRWGGENQITVRVKNVAFAGGIWKPVTIETLTFE